MAGSPKKREREKTARLMAAEQKQEMAGAPTHSVPALGPQQEVLPPIRDEDLTRTAKKRAMRIKAQEFAEDAMTVLKDAMSSPDERLRVQAANDILAWGFGKPTQDVEVGNGGQTITILRFGDQ